MKSTMNVCSECKFYLPLDSANGVCRRNPPRASGTTFFSACYPRVEKDFAACGEFKPKTLSLNSNKTPTTKTKPNRRKK